MLLWLGKTARPCCKSVFHITCTATFCPSLVCRRAVSNPQHREELLPKSIWQTLIVTKSFDRFPIFHLDVFATLFLHLLEFGFGEVGLVVLPARSKLANVFCPSIYLLLYKVVDVNPCILVFVIVVVVKKVLRNHVFLQPLLGDLTFEEQTPHCGACRIRRQVRGGSVVRLVPSLIILSRVPCHYTSGRIFRINRTRFSTTDLRSSNSRSPSSYPRLM